jgi:hypothetical protein
MAPCPCPPEANKGARLESASCCELRRSERTTVPGVLATTVTPSIRVEVGVPPVSFAGPSRLELEPAVAVFRGPDPPGRSRLYVAYRQLLI